MASHYKTPHLVDGGWCVAARTGKQTMIDMGNLLPTTRSIAVSGSSSTFHLEGEKLFV